MIKKDKSFVDNRPILYLVATPIGNLKDFTYRAVEILSSVDIIACEDTRNTKKLLSFYNINKPLLSLHEHNELSASETLIEKIKNGEKAAYVSDAGYPLISDPGQLLVKQCIANDIKVSVVPGANAMLMGLVGANISSEHFYFYGFLSPKNGERIKQLNELKEFKDTIIFYEAPHRIKETLKAMYEVLSNRQVCLARELSKMFEEYIRFNLNEYEQLDYENLKGEMVIIVEGNSNLHNQIDDDFLIELINKYLKNGQLKDKEIAKEIANQYQLSKNYIYDLIIKIKNVR